MKFSVKKIILYLGFLLLLLGSFGLISKRIDLTSDKRYSLSDASIQVLKSVKKPLNIEVFLDGDFPANFKQLQNETKFLVEEFHTINPKIDFKFIDPIKTKMSQDTLMAMGMQPSKLSDMKDGKISEIILFPYAGLKYDGYGISFSLISQQTGVDAAEQLNRSMENLEYAFISNIKSIITEKKKNIGILVNQNELRPEEFQGFMQMALESYNVGPILPKKNNQLSTEDISTLNKYDAIVVAKPRKAFGDEEKLILDQYIMNGGKSLWMIDAVNAEMDTLVRSKKILAYPIELNLNDFFFNYGIRINPGLVLDTKKTSLLRLVSGEVAGNPQYSSFLWPYFPLGIAENKNPITNHLNPVKFEFPTSIDTLSRPGIKFQVLYESSERNSLKSVPNFVSLSEIINNPDSIKQSHNLPKIFAVALEGKFRSAYANRFEKENFPDFKNQSIDNKMIVIADGDVARNQILKGKALPLGYDVLTDQQYGNAAFLKNTLEYLLEDDQLIALRNRNFEAKLLDRQRINDEADDWKWFNLLLPLVIIGIFAAILIYLRKKKFS